METREHATVGWRFRAHGSVYLCIRWVREAGFDMRLEKKGKHDTREVGEVVNVSDRAIGGLYRMIWENKPPEPHEPPCNCWVCENRTRGA